MGFAEGFSAGSSGLRGALQMAYDRERQDKEMAMRQEAERRAAEEHRWRLEDRQRLGDAYSAYDQVTTGYQPPVIPDVPADESDGIGVPGVAIQPARAALTGTAADMARTKALGRIAAASRNFEGLRQTSGEMRGLQMSQLAAEAVRVPLKDIESQLPSLNTNTSAYPMLFTGKDKNGYTFLTTDSDGSPGKKFSMNEAQIRQFYLAHRLSEAGYGTEALATMSAVNKDLGEHVSKWNSAMQSTATTNNSAVHNGNQDQTSRITANAAATSAGATAALSRAHQEVYGLQSKVLRQELDGNTQARQLAVQYESLSPAEQAGPKGQGLVRQFNILNVKPGAQLQVPGGGRPAATLSDAEKIAYGKAVDEISMIPVDKATGQADPARIAQTYRKYGLDPARFGFESELDKRLKAFQTGGASDTQAPAAMAVPGRPHFNTPTATLKTLAKKPRGVSSADAAAAADELMKREGESRMSPY